MTSGLNILAVTLGFDIICSIRELIPGESIIAKKKKDTRFLMFENVLHPKSALRVFAAPPAAVVLFVFEAHGFGKASLFS